MQLTLTDFTIEPLAVPEARAQRLSTTMLIHDWTIDEPAVVAYLRDIAPDELEATLVDALEIGVTQMQLPLERCPQ